MCGRVGHDRTMVNSISDAGCVVTVGGEVWLRVLRVAGVGSASPRHAVGLSGRRGFGSLSLGPSAVSTVCHRRVVVGLCRVLGFAAGALSFGPLPLFGL